MSSNSTYPQPWGVTTPKGQSPAIFSTTWSSVMGVMTMPAVTMDVAKDRTATSSEVFIVMRVFVVRLAILSIVGGVCFPLIPEAGVLSSRRGDECVLRFAR